MKRLTTLLLMTTFPMVILADGHMKFKGIEMTGNSYDFARTLQTQGNFYWMGKKDHVYLLSGQFAGYSGCTIGVVGNQTTDEVFKVAVMFSLATSWSDLYGTYIQLKGMLTTKYGKPNVDQEKWQSSTNPTDDITKFYEVTMERCKFATIWELEAGTITLEISGGINNQRVLLCYYDNQSQNVAIDNAINDL